jgi:hypothetical protein
MGSLLTEKEEEGATAVVCDEALESRWLNYGRLLG